MYIVGVPVCDLRPKATRQPDTRPDFVCKCDRQTEGAQFLPILPIKYLRLIIHNGLLTVSNMLIIYIHYWRIENEYIKK